MRFSSDSVHLTFVSEWLRDPRGIGSLIPSTRSLAIAMAQLALRADEGIIVELGPGTGVITGALIESGIARDRLYLVESNPRFAACLRERFPGVRVTEGDAAELFSLAGRDGLTDIASVVSGLPLRILDRRTCRVVLEQSFRILRASGAFYQFTYGYRPPVSRGLVKALGLTAQKVGHVWFNFPPASLWEFQRLQPLQSESSDQLRPLSAYRELGHVAPAADLAYRDNAG